MSTKTQKAKAKPKSGRGKVALGKETLKDLSAGERAGKVRGGRYTVRACD